MSSIIKKILKQKSAPKGPDRTLTGALPRHIAIIMDGNGRWAQARSLPRIAGHRAGMEAFKRVIISCTQIGIPYLTVYAFSTENWKRPQDEVDGLMGLLIEYIEKELNKLDEKGVRVRTIGLLSGFPETNRLLIEKAVSRTQSNNKLKLQIALNYGGRDELVRAVSRIAQDVRLGKITAGDITENLISQYLDTAGLPDPDLIIRTSGEMRLSNFLLWQSAYAEYWPTPVLWPDFGDQELYKAISDYQNRHRRYGGV